MIVGSQCSDLGTQLSVLCKGNDRSGCTRDTCIIIAFEQHSFQKCHFLIRLIPTKMCIDTCIILSNNNKKLLYTVTVVIIIGV